jgi:hypothetical protein
MVFDNENAMRSVSSPDRTTPQRDAYPPVEVCNDGTTRWIIHLVLHRVLQ